VPISIRRLCIATCVLATVLLGQDPGGPEFDRRTPIVLAVERVGPAVVNIRAQAQVRRPHMFSGLFMVPTEEDPVTGRMYQDSSLGSGVVVHPEGFVVTNEHVVHGADRVLIKFQSGREVPARTVNANADNDIAVLRIEAPGPFPSATLGSSSSLLVGETVIALGNPFGLSSSATTGILSAVGRPVAFRGRTVFEDFLQTSALINPGNSGGPLLDINGRVIGINTAIDSRGQGIGFAIPVNRVKEVMTELVDPELTRYETIGVHVDALDARVVVKSVDEGGPAARAGVRPGDVVLAVNDRPVQSPFDFNIRLLEVPSDQDLELRLERGRERLAARARLQPVPVEALVRGRATLLGMECGNPSEALAQRLRIRTDVQGPVVLRVDPGSAAASLGVRPGDVILQVGRLQVRTVEQLGYAIQRLRPRGGAPILVYREGEGTLQGTLAF
jgi:serine protease Do